MDDRMTYRTKTICPPIFKLRGIKTTSCLKKKLSFGMNRCDQVTGDAYSS
jgi:hypothetical protein